MFKLALGLADKVTVRDMFSKRFIEGFITGRRITLELDPSLRLKPDVHSAENVLRSLGLSEGMRLLGLMLGF